MGNIGSHTGQISQRPLPEEQQWAHSFPRTQPPKLYQPKVLPERDARQKLRTTNNGEILQSGGTLTGRPHQTRLSLEKEDDVSASSEPRNPQTRSYFSNQRDPLHKSGYRYTQILDNRQPNGSNQIAYKDQMKRFGSEPDLRYPPVRQEHSELRGKSRAKKKYRAPPPPRKTNAEKLSSLDWDENLNGTNGSPIRRARLFKTRAETKKNYSSPVNNHKSINYSDKIELLPSKPKRMPTETNEAIQHVKLRQRGENKQDLRPNRLSLPETKMPLSITDFQEELKEATKRLRNAKLRETNREIMNNERNQKQKLKTLDHSLKKDDFRMKFKQINEQQQNKITAPIDCIRGEGSGKESTTPEQSPPIRVTRANKEKQPKTFYFGMNDPTRLEGFNNELIDTFASNLHVATRIQRHSSESDLSSELEMDENQTSRDGIDLQLRPILPKKQLEIPRFSPAAAWRLLSALDVNLEASTIGSDDIPVFIEERIEKLSRPPPPTMQVGPRSTNDKSGDSGISGDNGDAGPACYDDSPDGLMSSRKNLQMGSPFSRTPGLSWTPQQDLGDDSSLEEGLNIESYHPQKYTNKPHVFSLSLPRDNHLADFIAERQLQSYTGLQKLKRSVSGVLNNLGNPIKKVPPNSSQDQSDNWFLSKSAPNSLNNGFNSLDLKNSHKSDDNDQSFIPAPKHNSGRLMYLPEFDNYIEQRQGRGRLKDDFKDRSRSVDRSHKDYKLSVYSKSCENITAEIKSSSEPEDLQDPPRIVQSADHWRSNKKPKRFTFQSTVRQIERKRLAEKLSREAERKEMQRLRELEAMQKVEEEFQKKRAREKATIRQQLILFSMDDSAWSSLPPHLEIKDEVPTRPEPDGAVSSSATSSPSLPLQKSPEVAKKFQKNKKVTDKYKHRASSESSEENKVKAPATQILSEYRQPQREYKEYRGSTRYLGDLNEHYNKQTTVHPQVTCNMPKAKGQSTNKSGSNYRKDFAHGVKSSRSAGSSYSEDSQSRNNSPRMYHNKHSPITRF